MRKRNMHTGLVVFWVKLRQKGYTRSITSLWRVLKRLNLAPVKPPNPKYIPKPYEKMLYPGQRVQIDVKFVPEACIVGDAKAESSLLFTAEITIIFPCVLLIGNLLSVILTLS